MNILKQRADIIGLLYEKKRKFVAFRKFQINRIRQIQFLWFCPCLQPLHLSWQSHILHIPIINHIPAAIDSGILHHPQHGRWLQRESFVYPLSLSVSSNFFKSSILGSAFLSSSDISLHKIMPIVGFSCGFFSNSSSTLKYPDNCPK